MRHMVIALAAVIVAMASAPAVGRASSSQLQVMPRGAPAQIPPTRTESAPPPVPPPATTTIPVAPPIVFPFPPLMPPPTGGLTPRFAEDPRFRTHSPLFGPNGSPFFAPFIFGYPGVAFGYPGVAEPVRKMPAPPAARVTGLLRLSVTPVGAHVFVDSYYVGTVEEINARRGLELEAGPHRIEIRAPQYQPITVDVRILPYETVTYSAALELMRLPPPVPPAAAGPPTPMYLIPNCYLGNVPPRPSRLPAGCDIKQVQVLRAK